MTAHETATGPVNLDEYEPPARARLPRAAMLLCGCADARAMNRRLVMPVPPGGERR